MTLGLVVDNSNVTELPVGNLMNLADMARRFADGIEAGEFGHTTRAIVVVETETGLAMMTWGEGATPYEMMGLFEAAKLNVFADHAVED